MASSTLSNFKGALEFGGARPSLFEMTVSTPSTIGNNFDDMKTHCNVSAIPPLTVTPIERQYFGRTVKIPGDMVFGDLNTTIINSENFSIRNDIDDWMNAMNTHVANVGFSNNNDWAGSLTLTQYSKDGESLMTWTFVDCWPQTVAEIALSYDTASDIEQYDVTWAYNYYTSVKGKSSHLDSTFAKQE